MGVTVNYIDESERIFVESVYLASLGDLWRSDDATLAADPIVYQDAYFGSLSLSGAQTATCLFNRWANPVTATPSQYALNSLIENDDYVESFCWVRPTQNCTITMRVILHEAVFDGGTQQFVLVSSSPNIVSGENGTHRIEIGATDRPAWHIVRSVPVRIPNDNKRYSIGFELQVVYDSPSAIGEMNISRPTAYRTYAILDNKAMINSARIIPNVFLSKDPADFTKAEPTFPLLRIIDIATNDANDVQSKHDEIEYIDISEGFAPNDPTAYSTLVNPVLADADTLAWLSQFMGRNLIVSYEPSTEGSPWQQFTLDSSVLDGDNVLASSGTPTTNLPGGVEEYFKWQVRTGFYGINAGSVTAMLSAIQLFLSGDKTINYVMTANTIHFQTSQSETYGGGSLNIGDPSPYILAVVEAARPLGMLVTHELVA